MDDCLDDLAVRFLLYLPQEDTATIDRLGFHLEQAFWFYTDLYHQRHPSTYPPLSMNSFVSKLLERCRLHGHSFPAVQDRVDQQLAQFNRYKATVPVCGVALVSTGNDKVLMVKGVGRQSRWTFPKGKINKDERPWQCARRECFEECGFLPPQTASDPPHVDALLDGKPVRVYIVTRVDELTRFAPRTRNEIGAIAWHRLADLPTKRQHPNGRLYHHVVPFVKRIRQIIAGTSSDTVPSIVPSTVRVSMSELMRRSIQQQQQSPPIQESQIDTQTKVDTQLLIIDSEPSDQEEDDNIDELESSLLEFVPVWKQSAVSSGESAALLKLLTQKQVMVDREECVRRIGAVIPKQGLPVEVLERVVELLQ